MKSPSNLFAVLALMLSLPLVAEERTWTSSDGRELKAELVSYDLTAETVTIKNSRGEFTLPFAKISEDDQAFVKALAVKEAEEQEAAAKEAAGRAGKTTREETAAGNSYHVYYPKTYSVTQKPPLLILFSPGGGGAGILKNFRQGADALGWALVGCDKLKNGMPDDEGNKIFEDLLTAIEKRVDHDPNLLYMGGMSGGGLRAYKNSAVFDRPWKGIISCGGWLGGSVNYDLDYRKKMAVAMVNGDKDKNANHYVGPDTAVLEKRRCEVELFAFPGGHVVGPPDVIAKAMTWVSKNTDKD